MDQVLEYLARKHREICETYENTPENERVKCNDLAMEVAIRLLREGKIPRILRFSEDWYDKEKGVICTRKIHPVIFGERIEWNFHDVCQHNSLMYDPFLGKPVFEGDYEELMFRKKVRSIPKINTEEIPMSVQRYIRKLEAA